MESDEILSLFFYRYCISSLALRGRFVLTYFVEKCIIYKKNKEEKVWIGNKYGKRFKNG